MVCFLSNAYGRVLSIAKLLIAVKSEIISAALADILTLYEVSICHNGRDALLLLETMQPDVFIVELSLPVVTGLTVLQQTCYRPPIMLALTDLVTEHTLQAADHAGVQDMILLPCPIRHIARHLETMIQKVSTPEI